MRWQLEVTFQEVRRHLGFETQRQWSDLAIRRTTPALMGLFSLITLFAHRHDDTGERSFSADRPGTTRLSPDVRRRFGRWCVKSCGPAGADFLRVALAQTDTVKVPRAYRGTPNRCALLRSLMAKVELRGRAFISAPKSVKPSEFGSSPWGPHCSFPCSGVKDRRRK